MSKYKKIAEELNISEATIRNWIKTGLLSEKEISQLTFDEIKKKIKTRSENKLSSRANKFLSKKTFIPSEYFQNFKNHSKFIDYLFFLSSAFSDEQTENKLFITAIYVSRLNNFFKKQNTLKLILENLKNNDFKINIYKELSSWYSEINFQYSEKFEKIFEYDLPKENDLLGILFQSLKSEGEKSEKGSYYTPKKIVDQIASEHLNENFKVLDPACGTGQFLLAFAEKTSNPEMLYGFDNDKTAVRIARINLILKYKKTEFTPNIFKTDSILEKKTTLLKSFDFIATNPPWGAYFSDKQKNKLKILFPDIKSYESASYFISLSKEYLKENAKMTFILPASILNVKIHEDIRKTILSTSKILKIKNYNKIFKNVFSDVIRIDLQKNSTNKNNFIKICDKEKTFKIQQKEYSDTSFHAFSINTTSEEFNLLRKIYSVPHINLKGQSKFALGIVTGNNKKYLSDYQKKDYEIIYTGKEMQAFKPKKASKFIKFSPDSFHQISPLKLYRIKEKLIYKFISKKLVFSYDNQQSLTLNSANILIPQIPDYDIKIILALFNSSLYNFIFQKKFNSLKVLRSHIEKLPIPLITEKQKKELINISNDFLNNKYEEKMLNYFIFDIFGIQKDERKYFITK